MKHEDGYSHTDMLHIDVEEEEEDYPKEFRIELTCRTTVTAKDRDEAIKLARETMVKYPFMADVTFFEEA